MSQIYRKVVESEMNHILGSIHLSLFVQMKLLNVS